MHGPTIKIKNPTPTRFSKVRELAKKYCLLCHILIRVMKTGWNPFRTVTWYLYSTLHSLEPTAIRNSGSVPVEMDGCEDVRFKECAVFELLWVEKIPPFNCHGRVQAVCGINVLRSAQSDGGYGSLSNKFKEGKFVWGSKVEKASDYNKTEFKNLLRLASCIEVQGDYVEKW
jgi:hypothetical protein